MTKLLSIITITFQAEKYIERTLQNVIQQPGFDQVEYLVIDGASKDRTLEIIENYREKIDVLISEKDQGIYDAMNKGLAAACGKYVLFMNAGDTFATKDTLSYILQDLQNSPDVLYGETNYITESGEVLGTRSQLTPQKLPQKAVWQDFKYGMVICHQSFIAKRSIAPFYDLKYHLSSDVDWEIKCLKAAKRIVRTDYLIANYLIGGASVNHLKKSWTERYQVLSAHFGTISTIFHHLFIIFRGFTFAWKRKGKYW